MGNPEQSALPEAGEDLFGRYGCAVTLACAAQYRAKESALSWPGGRRVLLRILSEN
jgi:hypothetical protein